MNKPDIGAMAVDVLKRLGYYDTYYQFETYVLYQSIVELADEMFREGYKQGKADRDPQEPGTVTQ